MPDILTRELVKVGAALSDELSWVFHHRRKQILRKIAVKVDNEDYIIFWYIRPTEDELNPEPEQPDVTQC